MNTVRTLGRLLLPASLVILAACQSVPPKQTTAEATTPSTPAQAAPTEVPAQPAQRQGAPIAVFLADTVMQSGRTPVAIQSGALYVNPQPVITRDDLSGIQAGSNKQGEGLLALQLNDAGKARITDVTTKNPNKRLALVVGRTMMAAPSYSSPVTTGHLIFAVGTEQNATAAARAVAGVDDNGAGASPATSVTPSPGMGTSGSGTSGTGTRQ
jgi:preprotein translocase subunit SecD